MVVAILERRLKIRHSNIRTSKPLDNAQVLNLQILPVGIVVFKDRAKTGLRHACISSVGFNVTKSQNERFD